MPLILRVLTYCKQPLAAPMEHRFDHLGGTIGRSPDNSFVLADASKFVSRHHCRVEYSSAEGGFTLTDLGSNASHVGGVPVGNGKSRRLNHMDAVTIGDYQLQVVLEEQVATPAAFEFQATPSHHMIPEENYLGAPTPNANSLGSEFDDPLAMASILKGGGLGGDPLGLGGDPLSGGMGAQQGGFRGSESDHLPAFNMPYVAQQQAHSPAAAPASGAIPADFFSAPSAPLQPAQPAWGAPAPAAGGAGMIPDDFDIFGGPINPPATPMNDPLGGAPLGGSPSAGMQLGAGPLHAPGAPAVTLEKPVTTPAPAPIPATDFDPLGAPTLGAPTPGAPMLGSDFDPLGGLGAPAGSPTLGSDFDPLGTMLGGNQAAAPIAAPRPGMRGNSMGTLPPTNTAPATLASSGGLQSNAPMTLPPSMVPPFPKTIASRVSSQEAPPEVQAPAAPVFVPPPPVQPAQPAQPAAVPAAQAAPARPAAAVAAVAATAPAGAADSEVMAALLRGLGLPDLKTKFSDVATAELCGTMLRSAVAGTMDVLLARSMTKREIRVEATMLAQQGNNPMKFFPDPNQALTQMLTNAWAGYLPGARAMNDAFDDLKAHELATIAGMRAALAGVLERFDPAEIEKRLAVPTVMDKMMASSRKAKMWDQMVALYRTMSAEADDDFQRLFGEKFAAAYEEQTTRMRMNRK